MKKEFQYFNIFKRGITILAFACFVCLGLMTTQLSAHSENPKDGELHFPDYKQWPTFIKGVQKPNMVRDIFVNPTGAKTKRGSAFSEGSTLVMEIYKATMDGDTKVKGDLAKVYVMQKGKDWGKNAPKGLGNGDWIYSAFSPDGKPIKVDYNKCRGCHMPLKEEKDFVHRYDEYFDKRGH